MQQTAGLICIIPIRPLSLFPSGCLSTHDRDVTPMCTHTHTHTHTRTHTHARCGLRSYRQQVSLRRHQSSSATQRKRPLTLPFIPCSRSPLIASAERQRELEWAVKKELRGQEHLCLIRNIHQYVEEHSVSPVLDH